MLQLIMDDGEDTMKLSKAIVQSNHLEEILICSACKACDSKIEFVNDPSHNILSTCKKCGKQRKFKI